MTIGLNMAQMSEKLITYALGFPKSIQVDMNGCTFFSTLQLEEKAEKKRLYMAIYSKDPNTFVKVINTLPYMTNTIMNAMEDIIPFILNQ